ncbi:MAG: hypothetical protein RLZZ21_1161 [Planctomycetota bacterium]
MIKRNLRPAGMTLVEMLVVIAIIALLIALLLPAIQAARESARRVHCGNSLKQIALAVTSYATQMGVFPYSTPEAAYKDDPVELARQGLHADGVSWMVRLLPFIEQGTLFDTRKTEGALKAGRGLATNDPGTRAAIRTAVPGYYCASDDAVGKTRTDVWSDGNWYAGIPMAVSNYAGVIGPTNITTGISYPGLTPYCNNRNSSDLPDKCPGSFWRHTYYVPVRLASFRDGTSTTAIVGERVPALNPWCVWPAANTAHAFHATGLNYVDRQNGFEPDGTPKRLYPANFGFGSRHPGGAMFAYADGHVAFLDDLVPISIYFALSTRAGTGDDPLAVVP